MKNNIVTLHVQLDDALHAALVQAANKDGRTIRAFVHRLLRSSDQVGEFLALSSKQGVSAFVAPVEPSASHLGASLEHVASTVVLAVPEVVVAEASAVPSKAVPAARLRPDGLPYAMGFPQVYKGATYHSSEEWQASDAFKNLPPRK